MYAVPAGVQGEKADKGEFGTGCLGVDKWMGSTECMRRHKGAGGGGGGCGRREKDNLRAVRQCRRCRQIE